MTTLTNKDRASTRAPLPRGATCRHFSLTRVSAQNNVVLTLTSLSRTTTSIQYSNKDSGSLRPCVTPPNTEHCDPDWHDDKIARIFHSWPKSVKSRKSSRQLSRPESLATNPSWQSSWRTNSMIWLHSSPRSPALTTQAQYKSSTTTEPTVASRTSYPTGRNTGSMDFHD